MERKQTSVIKTYIHIYNNRRKQHPSELFQFNFTNFSFSCRRRLLGVLLLLLLTQTYQLTDNDTAKTNSTDSTTNLTNATTEDYVTVTTEDSIERTMPLLEDIAPGGGYEKMEHRVSLGQEAVVPDADFYSVERREIEDAVDYGLRKMHELVLVKEPELYRKGKKNVSYWLSISKKTPRRSCQG